MRKLKLFFLIAFVAVSDSFAQCPVAGFALPNDTLCSVLQFTNTSSAGNYQWDFCPGDLMMLPTGANLGNPGGLSSSFAGKIINDNGNYYAFITNNSTSNIVRVDYGSSLENPSPDTFSYAGFNSVFGIDVFKDGSTWYAFVLDYGGAQISRINLGTSISNNSSVVTNLGGFGFSYPRNVKVMKDDNNYFVFVTNAIGGVTKLEFGSSLGNPVTNSSTFTHSSLNSAWGIDIVYDCSSSKYIGFVSNNAVGDITVIDYGNSLLNPGAFVQTISVLPLWQPSSLQIVRDEMKWHLLFASLPFNKLGQLILGDNLLNASPAAGFMDTIGQLSDPRGLSMIKDSSSWYGIITNNTGSTLTRFKFENNCTANIPYSTDTVPQNIYYTGGGWQHISLSVSDSGLTSFFTDSIYSIAPPVVNFRFSAACTGQPISFHDSTLIAQGTIVSWQWDFGDGTGGSTDQNPVHTFTNDSTYSVTLTVMSDAGCSSSYSANISVHDLPVAGFSYLNNQCSETFIQFNDLSTTAPGDSATAWEWNFGDNTAVDLSQNPLHAFDSSGTYAIQLIVFGSSGCSDTLIQSVTILPRPVAGFEVSQTCVGEVSLFNNSSVISDGSALTYNWDFGDGSPVSNSINPTHPYPLTPLTYTVQLIAFSANGCNDTLSQNVRIGTRANPGFIFQPGNACIGNQVQFIDTSTVAAGDTIAHSAWDFGDSSSATGDTVNHVYTASGTYTVTLTVTTLTSCDTVISQTITVLESPVANFTFTNVCLSAPMYFYDLSSTPIGSTLDSIIWDFGDGSILAYGDTVIHGFSTPGIFNVTQTVINNFGCSGTITQQVTVHAPPVASFTTNSPICTGNAVNFTNTSTVQNDSITGNQWDFGTGDTSIQQNPSYNYISPSTYFVSLIVTSSHGCQATITQPVTVLQSPLFNFTASLFCIGDSTHFTYHPLNAVQVQGWLWNFGDGGSSILPSPAYSYDSAGDYNVNLIVSALNGCSNSISQLITINPKPSAGIASDSISCFGTTMTFGDNSTISSGTINQWFWDFGDGTATETTQNTTHNYGNDSTFNVIHIVTSDAGCRDTFSLNVAVEPMPVASFTPNPTFGSPPLLVQFNNTTTGAVSYHWNFGDGGTDLVLSPSYTYSDTGYYEVTLIATNAYNCSDTAYGYISVLIPDLDLAVKEIRAFQSKNLFSLFADLVNLGNIPIYKFQISAKIENGSPINEQWSSSSPLNPGSSFSYPFTARYEIDPLNMPSFYCIEVSEINDMTDAIESNNKKCSAVNDLFELFDIYPNPASDQVIISMNVPLGGTIDINVYNSAGQLMKLHTGVPVKKGYNEFNYPVRNLAKGFYACTVKYREDVKVKKIAKR